MITFSYYFGRWNNLLKTKAFSKMFGYKKPNWTFPKYLINIAPFSWKMSIKNWEIWSDLSSICNICLWRRLTFCIFFVCISAGVLQWLGYYYNFFIVLGNKEVGWILIMNIVLELTRPVNQLNLTVLYWLWLPYSVNIIQRKEILYIIAMFNKNGILVTEEIFQITVMPRQANVASQSSLVLSLVFLNFCSWLIFYRTMIGVLRWPHQLSTVYASNEPFNKKVSIKFFAWNFFVS